MNDLEKYLQTIANEEHRMRLRQVFEWVMESFPSLVYEAHWNQPMFVEHGTFIIGFSVSKDHLAVSPELEGMKHFSREIAKAGYTQTKNLFRIRWNDPVDFELLKRIIAFNREDKANDKNFWRKVS